MLLGSAKPLVHPPADQNDYTQVAILAKRPDVHRSIRLSYEGKYPRRKASFPPASHAENTRFVVAFKQLSINNL
jgi:hypothetical protein